jgi:hypothetical protein
VVELAMQSSHSHVPILPSFVLFRLCPVFFILLYSMTNKMVWIYHDLSSGGIYIISLHMVNSMHARIYMLLCILYDTLSSKILSI